MLAQTTSIALTGSISRDLYGFSLRFHQVLEAYEETWISPEYIREYLLSEPIIGTYAFILAVSFIPEYDPYGLMDEVMGGEIRYKLILIPQ